MKDLTITLESTQHARLAHMLRVHEIALSHLNEDTDLGASARSVFYHTQDDIISLVLPLLKRAAGV